MRAQLSEWLFTASPLLMLAAFPAIAGAQTEGLPAIARETFRPRSEVVPIAPAPSAPVVTERVAVERRPTEPLAPPVTVVEKPPVAVVEKPVIREAVAVAGPVTTWWSAFSRNRYGYYDDGFVDDDWYYDYYEMPRATPVVVARPAGTLLGFRTNWIYEPAAERGLFSW